MPTTDKSTTRVVLFTPKLKTHDQLADWQTKQKSILKDKGLWIVISQPQPSTTTDSKDKEEDKTDEKDTDVDQSMQDINLTTPLHPSKRTRHTNSPRTINNTTITKEYKTDVLKPEQINSTYNQLVLNIDDTLMHLPRSINTDDPTINTAKVLWDKLELHFNNISALSVRRLLNEVTNMKIHQDEDITTLNDRLNNKVKDLQAQGHHTTPRQQLTYFLNALPDSFIWANFRNIVNLMTNATASLQTETEEAQAAFYQVIVRMAVDNAEQDEISAPVQANFVNNNNPPAPQQRQHQGNNNRQRNNQAGNQAGPSRPNNQASNSSGNNTDTQQHCRACNGNHTRNNCRHKNATCYNCGIHGHISRACNSRQGNNNRNSRSNNRNHHNHNNGRYHNNNNNNTNRRPRFHPTAYYLRPPGPMYYPHPTYQQPQPQAYMMQHPQQTYLQGQLQQPEPQASSSTDNYDPNFDPTNPYAGYVNYNLSSTNNPNL